MHGRPVTDEDRRKVIELQQAGLSYRAIAVMLDRPYGTIASMISAMIYDGTLERRREREDARIMAHYDR